MFSVLRYITRAGSKVQRDGVYNTAVQACLRFENLWFDFKHKVDTHQTIPLSKLRISNSSVKHGVQYQPILINHLRKILKTLEPTANDVFVDFGSGKGNVLLVSSMYPFKKVVGVEFSDQLCSIARENIRKFRVRNRCNIEINCIDAADYQINQDETIFYFFNPFDEIVMEKVINNIKTSFLEHARGVRVVFYNLKSQNLESSTMEFELITNATLHGIAFQIYKMKDG